MASAALTEATCLRGAFADLIPPQQPSLRQLADRLIAASQHERTCNDADWSEADDARLNARDAFRTAIERVTGMKFDDLERAIGEA